MKDFFCSTLLESHYQEFIYFKKNYNQSLIVSCEKAARHANNMSHKMKLDMKTGKIHGDYVCRGNNTCFLHHSKPP